MPGPGIAGAPVDRRQWSRDAGLARRLRAAGEPAAGRRAGTRGNCDPRPSLGDPGADTDTGAADTRADHSAATRAGATLPRP